MRLEQRNQPLSDRSQHQRRRDCGAARDNRRRLQPVHHFADQLSYAISYELSHLVSTNNVTDSNTDHLRSHPVAYGVAVDLSITFSFHISINIAHCGTYQGPDNEPDRLAVDFTIAVPDLVAVYFAIAGSNQAAYHQPVGVAFDVANYHADGVPDHLSDCAAFDVAIGIP